jgi:hypothetical protein
MTSEEIMYNFEIPMVLNKQKPRSILFLLEKNPCSSVHACITLITLKIKFVPFRDELAQVRPLRETWDIIRVTTEFPYVVALVRTDWLRLASPLS